MEPQEQGNRYKPASDEDAGTPEPRRSARDRTANPTARALIDDFASAARVWAQRLKVSPNRFFQLDDMHGKSIHWMRERYFGGVVPSLDDELVSKYFDVHHEYPHFGIVWLCAPILPVF